MLTKLQVQENNIKNFKFFSTVYILSSTKCKCLSTKCLSIKFIVIDNKTNYHTLRIISHTTFSAQFTNLVQLWQEHPHT